MDDKWFKSSYSVSNGNCVETKFTKSSYCYDCNCVEVGFKKSSHCESSGCVEVGTQLGESGGTVSVRDSKDPGGPVQTYTFAEWQAFIDGVKAGEFDL